MFSYTHNQFDGLLGFLSCTPDPEFTFICPFQYHASLLAVICDASALVCRKGVVRAAWLCCVNEVIVLIFRDRRANGNFEGGHVGRYWKGHEFVCPSFLHALYQYTIHRTRYLRVIYALFISILVCFYFYLFLYFYFEFY